MLRKLTLFLLLLCFTIPLSAQFEITNTSWELADISFSYPAHWDEPYAVQRFGVESLIIAESDVHNPDRAPEIPFVVLALLPYDVLPEDPTPFLTDRLNEFNIRPEVTLSSTLMDLPAVWMQGKSRDGAYMAIGTVTLLDSGVLTLIAQGRVEDADLLETVFQTISRSMVNSADSPTLELPYGTVWQATSSFGEIIASFNDISAMTLDKTTQSLLAVDGNSGVLRFDISTGRLLSIVPFDTDITPDDIAIGADGKVFIADTDCSCIYILEGDKWTGSIYGFATNAPNSIATTADGLLYATDLDDNGAIIRVFDDKSDTRIPLEESEQPVIANSANGEIILLSQTGDVLIRKGDEFTSLSTLNTNIVADDFDVMNDELYVIMSANDGILLFNSAGDQVDSINPLINADDIQLETLAIVTSQDGMIYSANSDGATGILAAFSKQILPEHIGFTHLIPNLAVGGTMNEASPRQLWLFDGQAQQTIDLALMADTPFIGFSLGLRLIAPDGRELGYSDGSELVDDELGQTDLTAALNDIVLRQSGTYEIYVEEISGKGNYVLNLSLPQMISLNPDETILWGELSPAKSSEQWLFAGQSGTTMTVTLQSISLSGLDPVLRILDSRGTVLEENDDAEDTNLLSDSQIVDYTIPYNGNFIIEATRFDGIGRYKLTVSVSKSQ